MRLRKTETFLFFSFALIFIIGYYRTFDVGFLSDGFGFIHQCREEGTALFSNNFHDYFYLPLTHTIAFAEFQLFGTNPIGFRIVHYFMHILNAWLLFLIIRKLLEQTSVPKNDGIVIALFSGALFLMHPYQTEGVVWLASRAYIWCVFFCLMAVVFWLKYTDKKKPKDLIFALLLFTAALFSKETALVLPVLIWGLEIIKERRLFTSNWRVLGLMLVPIVIYLTARWMVIGSLIGGYGDTVHMVSDPTVWMTHAAGYFAKFFLTYRYLELFVGSEGVWMVLGGLLVVGVAYLFLARKKKWDLPIFNRFGRGVMVVLCVMILVALLPVLSLEMTSLGSIQSDRYSYFPMIIVAFALVWLLYILTGKHLKWFVGPVLIVCTLFTWKTNESWEKAGKLTKSSIESLIEQADPRAPKIVLLNAPDNFRGAYMLRNKISDAVALKSGKKAVAIVNLVGIELFDEFEGTVLRKENNQWVATTTGYARFLDLNTHPALQFSSKTTLIKEELLSKFGTNEVYYYDGGIFRKLSELE